MTYLQNYYNTLELDSKTDIVVIVYSYYKQEIQKYPSPHDFQLRMHCNNLLLCIDARMEFDLVIE